MRCSAGYRPSLKHVIAAARTTLQTLATAAASTEDATPITLPCFPDLGEGLSLQRAVSQLEDTLIQQALERTGWNKIELREHWA